ncbi:TATA-binding protein-associated factor 2N [Tanacetum coccineum]
MPGDWVCESCQRQNFCWRQYCRNCNKPFIGEKGAGTQEPHSPRIIYYRPGDWFCDAGVCRAHNYASRYNCFKCGAVKSMPSFGGRLQYYNNVFPHMNFGFYGIMGGLISRRGWMPGDWFCGSAIHQGNWFAALRTKVVASVVSCLLVALSGKGEKKRQKEGKLLI